MADFPKRGPKEIVEELRDQAREAFEAMQPNRDLASPELLAKLGLPPNPVDPLADLARGLTIEDTLEWEAADAIEDLMIRLSRSR